MMDKGLYRLLGWGKKCKTWFLSDSFYVFLSPLPYIQSTMIQAIERYMKQAIVDRNSAVASSALVSSFVSLFRFSLYQEELMMWITH